MSVLKKTHLVADGGGLNFVTPRGRMTFVALDKKFKARDAKEGDDGAYIVAMLLDADTDIGPLYAACTAAVKEKFGVAAKLVDYAKGIDKGFRSPFLPADEKLSAEEHGVDSLEGRILLRANSYKYRPGVRNAQGEIVDPDELAVETYPGRFARIEVRVHAFDQAGNKGVKFYLQGVQLLARGEKLKNAGPSGTADNFAAVVDDEDEALA